jgi:hypothetical protein
VSAGAAEQADGAGDGRGSGYREEFGAAFHVGGSLTTGQPVYLVMIFVKS